MLCVDGRRCCARTWCIRRTFHDNPNIEPNESGFVIRPYNCTTGICEGHDDPHSSGLRCQGSNKGLSGIGRWLEHFDGNNLLVLTVKQDILIFHKMQSNHILWSLKPTICNNAVILDLTKIWKTINTTLPEHIQISMAKSQIVAKLIPNTHHYTTPHFPSLF